MTDTPEPVAVSRKLAVSFAEYIQGQSSTPRCEPPSEDAIKIAETLLGRVTGFFEAVGTPLYTAPISLYESQVRWRAAFDNMHARALKAEAGLSNRFEGGNTSLLVLVDAAQGLHDDLLRRAKSWDDDEACKVVCAGAGAWSRFCEALEAARAQGYGGQQ